MSVWHNTTFQHTSPWTLQKPHTFFIVFGKQIAVMEYPKRAANFESPEAWTVESVAKTVGGFFEGKQPVKDSFIVPPIF